VVDHDANNRDAQNLIKAVDSAELTVVDHDAKADEMERTEVVSLLRKIIIEDQQKSSSMSYQG
jgi:hypothetical protein